MLFKFTFSKLKKVASNKFSNFIFTHYIENSLEEDLIAKAQSEDQLHDLMLARSFLIKILDEYRS